MRPDRLCLSVISIVIALASGAAADDAVTVEPLDAVPGIAGVAYLDLARQLVPDIAGSGGAFTGRSVIDLRHIAGDDLEAAPPGTIELRQIEALPVKSDGKDRLLLLVDLGDSADTAADYTVLALYNLAATPKLLHAADVSYDRFTSFRSPPALSLGEGKDLVLVTSSHFNSNQSYLATMLVLIRNDRFQLVDLVNTFDDRSCAYDRTETTDFRVGDRDARTYPDIVATVEETVVRPESPCAEDAPAPTRRTITVTYRWDDASSRFTPDSSAFDELATENESRY